MDKKRPRVIFLLYIFILLSCAAQENFITFPVPDKDLYNSENPVNIENIIESSDKNLDLPDWLAAFLGGGVEGVRRIEANTGRYFFIASNQGVNFTALNKWADNFSVERDFPLFAAARIERRLNASNTVYPDEEFGIFYETLVKNAYSGEYNGAVKEDTYWIKTKVTGEGAGEENMIRPEVYVFYVLITIDSAAMQNAFYNLFSRSFASAAPEGLQAAAINRLRQNFFTGF